MNMLLTLQDIDQAEQFYRKGFWQGETMYARLRHWAGVGPERVAMRDSNSRLTYGELLDCVDELAGDLHAAGVRQGQRVSVWLPSRVETAIVMLACSRMGFVCNTSLHRDYTCPDIVNLLRRASTSAFFTQAAFGADSDKSDIFSMLDDLPDLKKVYRVAPLVADRAESRANLGLPVMAGDKNVPHMTSADRIVYLAFTSGTTGNPKGVMHSDNTLLSNGRAIVKDFGFDQDTVVYTISPMSHNMGIVGLVTTLSCGGTFVVHTPLDANRTLDRVIETKANYLIGVPTHAVDLLVEVQRRELTALGNVTSFQLGGSPIPSETVRTLLRLGVAPQNAFGMTENCSFQYTRRGDAPETIIETCGRSCEGMEMKIWDQDNADIELKPNEVGEMGCRGASLMLGYFDDQSNTEKSFNRHDWFMTGDLGSLDEGGNLRIVGRKKDLIIRGGHNIYPARIEEMAMRHENVFKAAAFPVADARLGEKVCLALIVKSKGRHSADEMLSHLETAGLSRYDMPELYVELESFPLTASGKILKRARVDMVKGGSIAPQPVRWQPSRL
jgi:acyl-CoA synthetase